MSTKTFVMAGLLLTGTCAFAFDCGRGTSPVEKAICHDPGLNRLDAEMNHRYSALRPKVAPGSRAQLLVQQRIWLAKRDRACAAGETACLSAYYLSRLEELDALTAAADVSEGLLTNVTPVIVKGVWKAVAIKDPAAPKGADGVSVAQSLADAELPPVGADAKLTPGELCLEARDCRQIGWSRRRLSQIEGGNVIGQVLGLNPSDLVLVGSTGAKWSFGYELVPRSDGTLWVIFGLCGPHASECRNAAEVWKPESADATFLPKF